MGGLGPQDNWVRGRGLEGRGQMMGKVRAWGSEPSSLGHPPEPSPPSPQPWSWDPSLRARCRQTMRTLVAEVLDFIELFNQGETVGIWGETEA